MVNFGPNSWRKAKGGQLTNGVTYRKVWVVYVFQKKASIRQQFPGPIFFLPFFEVSSPSISSARFGEHFLSLSYLIDSELSSGPPLDPLSPLPDWLCNTSRAPNTFDWTISSILISSNMLINSAYGSASQTLVHLANPLVGHLASLQDNLAMPAGHPTNPLDLGVIQTELWVLKQSSGSSNQGSLTILLTQPFMNAKSFILLYIALYSFRGRCPITRVIWGH